MKAALGYIIVTPVKKAITSASGIILEEDKGELDPHIYEVFGFNLDHEDKDSKEFITLQSNEYTKDEKMKLVISDNTGVNCCIHGEMYKIITPKEILAYIS